MVSFALVAWVIFLWHAVALRLLLLLGHVAAMHLLLVLLLLLIAALLHSACALGFCRSGAFLIGLHCAAEKRGMVLERYFSNL